MFRRFCTVLILLITVLGLAHTAEADATRPGALSYDRGLLIDSATVTGGKRNTGFVIQSRGAGGVWVTITTGTGAPFGGTTDVNGDWDGWLFRTGPGAGMHPQHTHTRILFNNGTTSRVVRPTGYLASNVLASFNQEPLPVVAGIPHAVDIDFTIQQNPSTPQFELLQIPDAFILPGSQMMMILPPGMEWQACNVYSLDQQDLEVLQCQIQPFDPAVAVIQFGNNQQQVPHVGIRVEAQIFSDGNAPAHDLEQPMVIAGDYDFQGQPVFGAEAPVYLFTAEPCDPADLNGDGIVDVQDLLGLLGAWGGCP